MSDVPGLVGGSKVMNPPLRLVGESQEGDRVGRPEWCNSDDQPLGRAISWSFTHLSMTLELRSTPAQRRVIDDLLGAEGKYDHLKFSDGAFRAVDRSSVDGFTLLNPPTDSLAALAEGVSWFVDEYSEKNIDQKTDVKESRLELVRKTERTYSDDDSRLWETRNSGEWLFEFPQINERIKTKKVTAEVRERGDRGVEGKGFTMLLEGYRLRPWIDEVSRLDAVSTREVPDGANKVEDNNPSGKNKIKVTAPTNAQDTIPDGTYIVRDWEADWIHDAAFELQFGLTAEG